MGFWIFMLCMVILVPLLMIIFGAYFKNKSPKEINYIFGYRTTMSMKNNDTWQFAHSLIGKIWIYFGIALLIISVIPMLFILHSDESTVGIIGVILSFIDTGIMILTIIPVERALKKNFDENGKRKE